jgi:hypothetical protein
VERRDPSKQQKEDLLQISKIRGLAAGAVTALAVLGSGVGVASAAPAAWNTSAGGPTTLATSLVLKVKVSPTDTRTYTCTPASLTSQAFSASNSPYGGQAELGFSFHGFCNGPAGPNTAQVDYYGPYAQNLRGEKAGTVYSLKGSDSAAIVINGGGGFWQSNYGRGANYSVPWTNGTNPLSPVSTATFNDTPVGVTSSGQSITLTGVVRFKTPANGLLTLI